MQVSMKQLRLNQFRKQYLIGKDRPSFYEIANNVLGLHSTDYWTPYLSVWARIGDYEPSPVFESLNSGDQLVRVSSFRGATHVVHVDNLDMIISATGPLFEKSRRKAPDLKNLSDKQLDNKIDKLVSVLSDEPLSMSLIKQALPEEEKILRGLIRVAMARGKVVRASASHARSNRTNYAQLPSWISNPDFTPMPEQQALVQLVESYVDIFGPVTLDDVVWWLGLKKGKAKSIIDELKDGVLAYEHERITYYLGTKDYERAGSINKPKGPLIWFLPYEDHFPKGYTNRSWFMDDYAQERLFPRLSEHYWPPDMKPPPKGPHKGMFRWGEMRPSIWVDGVTAGRWELESKGKEFRIVYGLFGKLNRSTRKLIDLKKESLETFVNLKLVPIS